MHVPCDCLWFCVFPTFIMLTRRQMTGVVGQLAALLVPGAGHSADAEVVQDAAAALQQPSGLEILEC